jgi:transposase
MAKHYDCVVWPARPAKPRDQAKVEVAVQIAERWILARLRNDTFYSLGELNRRIRQLLEELNERPMKKLGGASRTELFERLERTELKPLPEGRYEPGRWSKARVNIDYHIEHDKHYYSVPYQLLREVVEVHATERVVEVFHRGRRVASHRRGRPLAGHSTNPDHMPASHRAHMEWSPSRLISWGAKMGPHTRLMIESILRERPHPEMGYRSCLGILRLAKTYGPERLEAACERALLVGARSYQPVKAILKSGLDRQGARDDETTTAIPEHDNVRGPEYFH